MPETGYSESLTVFADAGYQGRLEGIAMDEHALELVIVPKREGQNTFVVLPKRWVVEAPSSGSRDTAGSAPTTGPGL